MKVLIKFWVLFTLFGAVAHVSDLKAEGVENVVSLATVGYQDQGHSITVSFPTEEMPEYIQGDGSQATYAVYLLASEKRTAYQFSHFGMLNKKIQLAKQGYIKKFLKEAEKIGRVNEAETLILKEDRANNIYSYITKVKSEGGGTVALFSDFYLVEGHLYVVSQIKVMVEEENERLDSGKDHDFFDSLHIERFADKK